MSEVKPEMHNAFFTLWLLALILKQQGGTIPKEVKDYLKRWKTIT